MSYFTPDPRHVDQLAREVITTELAGAATIGAVSAWAPDWPEYAVLDPDEISDLIDAVTTRVKHYADTITFPKEA